VELARRAGLVLDPWQADSIELMLSVREDGKWSCFEYGEIVARQNGKGAILEARALAGLFLLDEKLIMWSAHEYKTAMEGFRRFKALLKQLGEPLSENMIDVDGVHIKVINTNGEESFERLDTGARVKFIARSKGSGRGFSGDCNIIDEAFAYTLLQQDALMPTMSARPNPQIVYTSSPPLDGDDGSGEVMFALHARAEAGGDDSFGWRDWGVAGDLDHLDDIDLDDRQLWAASNPALGYRLSEEAVLRERRSMGDAGFARERLGVWPRKSQGNAVIDTAAWLALVDASSERDREHGVAIGLDISPLRDYAAVQVYGLRADGLGIRSWRTIGRVRSG
jgi:phage terminase large subunit-like protein